MSLSVLNFVSHMRGVITCVALAAVYLMLAGCARDNRTAADFASGPLAKLTEPADGAKAPDTVFFDVSADREVTLADFEGQVVLVNLWATWCAPCVDELPSLAALQREKGSPEFQVVAISVDRDALDAGLFLREYDAEALTLYHDPKIATARDMNAMGFPTTILYDKKGRELARLAGDTDWNTPEVHALIDWALGK